MDKYLDKYAVRLAHYGPLVARILLAQVFIISGFGKWKAFAATAAFMGNLGLPASQSLLVLTIALELGGGILLVLGWQARALALAFFVFTLLAAVVVHPFWNVQAPGLGGQLNNFMKNLAIMGGMLYVVIHGPGPLSLGGKQRNAPHVPQNKKR